MRRSTEENISKSDNTGSEDATIKNVVEKKDTGATIKTIELNKCPNNQSLRLFIKSSKQLDAILDNTYLWEKEPVGKFEIKQDGHALSSCFLKTIGKLKDELSYSNMIAHYLRSDDEMCALFINMLLEKAKVKNGGDFSPETSFSIEREEDHIDLLIRDKNNDGNGKYLIVIENKIHSGINGKKEDGGQLTVYAQKAYAKCKSELIPLPPQTTETKKKGNQDHNREPFFFLLTPNYSRIDDNERKTKGIEYFYWKNRKVEKGNQESVTYVSISYKDMYDFFSNRAKPEDDNIEKQHFEEFLTALYIHAQPTNNINELIMDDRVMMAIKRAQAKKSQ